MPHQVMCVHRSWFTLCLFVASKEEVKQQICAQSATGREEVGSRSKQFTDSGKVVVERKAGKTSRQGTQNWPVALLANTGMTFPDMTCLSVWLDSGLFQGAAPTDVSTSSCNEKLRQILATGHHLYSLYTLQILSFTQVANLFTTSPMSSVWGGGGDKWSWITRWKVELHTL